MAAARGYLSAVQWFHNKSPTPVPSPALIEEVIRSALANGRIHIVEWLMAMAVKERKFDFTVFRVIFDVLLLQPRGATLYWCWKSAQCLPKQHRQGIHFSLFDAEPESDTDPEVFPTGPEMWSLLCMIGAEAVVTGNKQVAFVTSILDDEDNDDGMDNTIALMHAWKGSPVFLQHLRAMGNNSNFKALRFPLRLDWACEAEAGVAVLDWMYAAAKCKASAEEYDLLVENQLKPALVWWKTMGLPTHENSHFES